MITSIGLNPCIDTVLNVKSIKPGHYDVKPKYFPGGSAINVVLVIDKLRKSGKIEKGTTAVYSGFIDKGKLHTLLLKKKILTEYCIFIKGESRVNYTLVPSNGDDMHLKSDGPYIAKDEYKDFENLYNKIIEDSNVITISGKLPKNAKKDYYNKFIEKANNYDLFTSIDTRGETLKKVINSRPFFIKCNLTELAFLLNKNRINSADEILEAEYIFNNLDIPTAVISGGKNGIYVFYRGKFLAQYKLSEEISTRSTTGAGDIILAYFSVLLDYVKRGVKKLNKETINETAINSVAYASASTLTSSPSVFEMKIAEKFLKKVITVKNIKKVGFVRE